MKTYWYLMRLRPPGPLCQPKKGLLQVIDHPVIHGDRVYNGAVIYDRPLDDMEIEAYELTTYKTEEAN